MVELKGNDMRCSEQNRHAADTIDTEQVEEKIRPEKLNLVRVELIQIATRYLKKLTTPEIAEIACVCAKYSALDESPAPIPPCAEGIRT